MIKPVKILPLRVKDFLVDVKPALGNKDAIKIDELTTSVATIKVGEPVEGQEQETKEVRLVKAQVELAHLEIYVTQEDDEFYTITIRTPAKGEVTETYLEDIKMILPAWSVAIQSVPQFLKKYGTKIK